MEARGACAPPPPPPPSHPKSPHLDPPPQPTLPDPPLKAPPKHPPIPPPPPPGGLRPTVSWGGSWHPGPRSRPPPPPPGLQSDFDRLIISQQTMKVSKTTSETELNCASLVSIDIACPIVLRSLPMHCPATSIRWPWALQPHRSSAAACSHPRESSKAHASCSSPGLFCPRLQYLRSSVYLLCSTPKYLCSHCTIHALNRTIGALLHIIYARGRGVAPWALQGFSCLGPSIGGKWSIMGAWATGLIFGGVGHS